MKMTAKASKQILSSALCRTCGDSNAEELYPLTSTSLDTAKTLAALLLEVFRIDVEKQAKIEYGEKLPQQVCGTCSRKLWDAYKFAEQARNTNEKLLALLTVSTTNNATADCLQEAPMEVCVEQFVDVKIEPEPGEESLSEFEGTPSREISGIPEDEERSADEKTIDPLIMTEVTKVGIKVELEADDKFESSSNSELDDMPLQVRKGKLKTTQTAKDRSEVRVKRLECDGCHKRFRWRRNLESHKRKHLDKSDWYPCTQCERKFWSKDGLRAHIKRHCQDDANAAKKVSATLCERKQAKSIDINLCKPHGCKLIQCMICLQKYAKFAELRRHLSAHPRIEHLTERQETLREIADSFYADIDLDTITEIKLLELIRKDLSAGKYAAFYSITNQSGYELSLDSSETESDWDGEATSLFQNSITGSKYVCELCKTCYRRKYQLFDHQRQQHDWQDAHHICRRCDARFISEQMLQHHYSAQCANAQKRFICRKCPLRFRWKQNLKAHYRDHPRNVQVLECAECHRSYKDKKSFTIHMLTVHTDESKLLPCHWCSRKFYRRDYMLKHLKRHGLREPDLPLAETLIEATAKANGQKRISCKVCNLNFERISELRSHLLIELKLAETLHQSYDSMSNYSITNEAGYELHIDDSETDDDISGAMKAHGSYTCEICHVQCRRKFEMVQHQRSMHVFEQMPHACDKCIFKCVSKPILEHHWRTQCLNVQKQLTCAQCSYKFMWPENLAQHMGLQHKCLINTEANATATTVCTYTNEQPFANTENTASPKLLQCPHCDRTYVQQSRLKNHIRDVHTEGGRKKKEGECKFLCSLCGRDAQSASNLVTHMRRHTGEKPFKCDMCDMGFPRHNEMIQHRRKHTGEKPYHCTVCGKDFARSDKLKRHMLTHSGLKPYKCTFCEKSYRQSKDLKLHLQQHTGETPHECGICGERFIQSVALEKHRMMRGHFDEVH